MLTTTALRYPAFRLVKAGERIALGDYAADIPWRPTSFTGTADVERVTAEFERGATIVLQALHLHHLPLAEFCRALEDELGHPAQANAYYTPRGAQGLPVHHDTHDVFCLQLTGEKRWLVYVPVLPLPLKEQRYDAELGGPGGPVLNIVLQEGDTLYLPRGWLHEAVTSETDSLHVTVGVNVYTRLDAVRAALEEVGREEVLYRRALSDGDLPVDELLSRLAERLESSRVERRRRQKFVRTRRPIRDDEFGRLRGLVELDVDTLVERRTTVIFDLSANTDEVTLSFEGRTLSFPAHARAEVEAAALVDGPFCAAELPGSLDEGGRLVLIRRLLREGFLRFNVS
jgi:bifunctional lysine-specific demethylase and histidyl-hydroxylase NO66